MELQGQKLPDVHLCGHKNAFGDGFRASRIVRIRARKCACFVYEKGRLKRPKWGWISEGGRLTSECADLLDWPESGLERFCCGALWGCNGGHQGLDTRVRFCGGWGGGYALAESAGTCLPRSFGQCPQLLRLMQHLPDSSEGARPLVRLGRCHTSLNSCGQLNLASEMTVTGQNQSSAHC